MTVQAAFRLGIKQDALLSLSTAEARNAQHELHDRRSTIFLDEYGMCTAHVFSLMHLRLIQLYPERAALPMAGRHIILYGDPFQLPPVGSSIFTVACDDALQEPLLQTARSLIRQFTQHTLNTVLRTRDPFWVSFLRRFCDPVRYPRPITTAMLQSTCEHCSRDGLRIADPDDHEPSEEACPTLCPHRCQHFKELNEADVARYPDWRSCKVVAPHNSTVDRFTLVKLRSIARETGQVVVRWRLPLTSSDDDAASVINDAQAEEMPQLFGYFVKGVPIRLTQNSNTALQLAHGSPAELHSLALRSREFLRSQLRTGQYSAGDVFTLPEPPLGAFVKVVGLRDEGVQALLDAGLPRAVDDGQPLIALPSKLPRAFTRRLEFGKDQHGRLMLYAHDPGFDIDVAGSIHSVQGDTTQYLAAEFNEPVYVRVFSLSSVYVAASRVPASCRFRVAPWNHAVGKRHLLDMTHNPATLRYLSSFNSRSGAFDLELLRRALEGHPSSHSDHPQSRRLVLPIIQDQLRNRRPATHVDTAAHEPHSSTATTGRRRTAADSQIETEHVRRVRPRVDAGTEGSRSRRGEEAGAAFSDS
jgi:hypothetical protein